MEDISIDELNREEAVAKDSIERYSGSPIEDFQPFLLITNFPRYADYFAESRNLPIIEGSVFRVAHSPEEKVSIVDFKIGSPAAALTIDLFSFLPIQGILLLGMCGGLRHQYKVGEYFVPVAAIRCDGTSDFYFPPEVPSLANFLVQKAVTTVLDEAQSTYHLGISHHTNLRFWEFNRKFRDHVKRTRAQVIEMECATLFMASYRYKLPLGALLLISDLPLNEDGVKTKESAEFVYDNFTTDHVEKGVKILHTLSKSRMLKKRLGRADWMKEHLAEL